MGTLFNDTHTDELELIQQSVAVKPATPKTKVIDLPGADGGRDLTEALGIGVTYNLREIVWTFALRPGASRSAKFSEVSAALNGIRAHIILDEDPDHFFDGRVSVEDYASDGLLHQITVKAVCDPWKRSIEETEVSRSLTTTAQTITLTNGGRMPVVPTLTATAPTVLTFGGSTVSIPTGTSRVPSLRLQTGDTELTARTSSGTGTLTITYREGEL